MTNPGKVLPEMLEVSTDAMGCILSYDGMSGISLPLRAVDMLTSMVDTTTIGPSATGRRKGIGHAPPNSFVRSLIFGGRNQNSASYYQSSAGFSGSQELRNYNTPSNHHHRPAIPSVGMNVQQRSSGQGPTVVTHGSAFYGARISREDYSKRQRGNGS